LFKVSTKGYGYGYKEIAIKLAAKMTVYRSLVLCTENKHDCQCHTAVIVSPSLQWTGNLYNVNCTLKSRQLPSPRPMAKITINKAPTISCFSYIAKRVGSEEYQQKVK